MRRFRAGALAAVLVGLGLLVAVATSASAGPLAKGAVGDPEASLSDAQREALHSAGHERNADVLREFNASHQDPQGLPRVVIAAWSAGPQTLADAPTDLAAVGVVLNTTFADGPNGGLPRATSTVRIERTIRGSFVPAAGDRVTVQQTGGPVASPTGAALTVLDADELLLPGDHVLVLLNWDPTAKSYRTVLGVGVNDITRDQRILSHGDTGAAQQLNGKSLDDALGLLSGT